MLQREANAQAVKVSRFALPETPTELTAVYRGPFGPVRVEVDPEWLREMIPTFSPRSRRGRQLQRLLRLHEERYTRAYAAREASGLGAVIRERERIDRGTRSRGRGGARFGRP